MNSVKNISQVFFFKIHTDDETNLHVKRKQIKVSSAVIRMKTYISHVAEQTSVTQRFLTVNLHLIVAAWKQSNSVLNYSCLQFNDEKTTVSLYIYSSGLRYDFLRMFV